MNVRASFGKNECKRNNIKNVTIFTSDIYSQVTKNMQQY